MESTTARGSSDGGAFHALLGLAAFVIVVAGLRAASSLLVPFLVALFLAILVAPPLNWMRRHGVSPAVSTLIVVMALVAIGMVVGFYVGGPVSQFVSDLPNYREKVQGLREQVLKEVGRLGVDTAPLQKDKNFLNTDMALDWLGGVVGSVGDLFSDGLLILFTAVFLLGEASSFPRKLRRISDDAEFKMMPRVQQITEDVRHYMLIKTWISLINGAGITLACWGVGVKYPLLWGLLSFVTNYIPNIGVFLAAVPTLLVAFLDEGLKGAGLMLGAFLVVEFMSGYVLEPRWAGKDLGISTLVVFLSLVFWGWILGPMGMLLSVPLTIAVKIALTSDPDTRWLAVLLSGEGRGSGRASS